MAGCALTTIESYAGLLRFKRGPARGAQRAMVTANGNSPASLDLTLPALKVCSSCVCNLIESAIVATMTSGHGSASACDLVAAYKSCLSWGASGPRRALPGHGPSDLSNSLYVGVQAYFMLVSGCRKHTRKA